MIRITKPSEVPPILTGIGADACQDMCNDYENGITVFEFDNDIYGDKTVKDALILAQHGKCFLCESKITHIDYGDVEHFRPKKAFCQSSNEKLTRPGYFWLAYRWENLLLACTLCNQRHKRNLFPLELTGDRATSPLADLTAERPLFINPADPEEEDPESLISFRVDELVGVIPYAIGNNPKGKATIKGGGIDRATLCQQRMALLKPVLTLYKMAALDMPQPESDQAKSMLRGILDDVSSDNAEYAGMFRTAVRTNFEFS